MTRRIYILLLFAIVLVHANALDYERMHRTCLRNEQATLDFINETLRQNPYDADAYYERMVLTCEHNDRVDEISFSNRFLNKTEKADTLGNRPTIVNAYYPYDPASDIDSAIRYWSDSCVNSLSKLYNAKAHLNYENGLAFLDSAVILCPRDPYAYINRARFHSGRYYASLGMMQQVLADFDKAIALAPENPEVYAARAEFYMDFHTEKYSNWAVADYLHAHMLQPDTNKYLNRFVHRTWLSSPSDQAMLDAIYSLDYANKDCYEKFTYSHDFAPDGVYSTRIVAALMQKFSRADNLQFDIETMCYFIEHDKPCVPLLLDSLSQRIKMSKNSALWYGIRAVVYHQTRNHTASRRDFDRTEQLSVDGNMPVYLLKWAYSAYMYDENERALRYVTAYINHRGGFTYDNVVEMMEVYFDRGLIQYYLHYYTEAITDYDSVAFVNDATPERRFVLYNRGWVIPRIAQCYEKMGLYDRAIEIYDSAQPHLTVWDDGKWLANEIARCYILKQDTALGYAILNTILSRTDEGKHRRKYSLYYYLNKYELAKKELEMEIMEYIFDPDETVDDWDYYCWACDYAKIGETKMAITYLRKAVKLGDFSARYLENDEDLDNIRATSGYKRILRQLSKKK